VTTAKPDGYTILFSSIATTQNPALFRRMPFDPLSDLVPVAKVGESPFVVAVNSERMPVKTLKEFVDLVRANPGKYNAAAGGLSTRLTVEIFRIQNDLQVAVIPYASAGVAANALMTGETDFMIVDAAPIMPGVTSGKIKVLAITSKTRSPELPDVPTTVEAGYPDYHETTYFGAYAPKGTPADVIAKLNQTLNEIAAKPDVAKRMATLGWTPTQSKVADFQAFYLQEIAKWKKIVTEAKIPLAD
jgi:tripartite-type tricarboxylate transporter receptor subunit TctC